MPEFSMTTSAIAFEDTNGHLIAEFERLALVLEAYEPKMGDVATPSDAIPGEPVARSDSAALALGISQSDREHVQAVGARIEGTAAGLADRGDASRLSHLTNTFELSRHHTDVLLLALLPVVYPQSERVFAELQNDLAATQPTIGLVADLFSQTPAEFVAATRLVGSESPLLAHDIVRIGQPDDTRINRVSRPIFVEERIESYLLEHEGIDPVLAPSVEQVTGSTSLGQLRLDDAVRERVRALAAAPGADRLYWHGPPGTEKRRAAEVVLSDGPFLRVDLPAIVTAGQLDRLRREAMLLDRPVHFESVSAATTEAAKDISVDDVIEHFEPVDNAVVMTGTDEWRPSRPETAEVDAIVSFPRPGFGVRRQFWENHADELPDDLDPVVLAGTFELTQDEHEAALATARSLAGGEELTSSHIYDGCSAQSAGGLAGLAEELDAAATWDDIELPTETMRGLRTVTAHVTYKGRIYHEWAFEERFNRGTGVVALFSGPSGTGKTMAAEIIAAEVGMRLFKIDLSSVVSKYIGETEENLERIFTEAEHSNAILLFDEADAVFGDRAAVSDATDRYANVEVNYLLQRIESYDGVVLLTTNFESNIDSAFMRRIDHSVEFRRPREAIRLAIWENIFPMETPVEDPDYAFLADFRLTGGDIRTIAQTAAILGADDEGAITMKHLVRGLQRELQKAGKMVDPQEFEPYRDFLYRE